MTMLKNSIFTAALAGAGLGMGVVLLALAMSLLCRHCTG